MNGSLTPLSKLANRASRIKRAGMPVPGKVEGLPLDDVFQGLVAAEDLVRSPERAIAVRRRERSQYGATEENGPSFGEASPLGRSSREDRFERERHDARETEREAAVKVGPEHHQSQHERMWRAPRFRRANKPRHPEHHQRKGQHMRPHQEVRRRQAISEQRADERGNDAHPLCKDLKQKRKRQPR